MLLPSARMRTSMARMIRLRAGIVCLLRHPVLGPLLIVLLAVALALLALHSALELALSAAFAFCGLTAVLAWAAFSLWRQSVGAGPPIPAERARPPTGGRRAPRRALGARFVPLRL